MKILFISIVSFLISILVFPQQSKDSVFVIISSDTIHIWDTGAYENCGCLFKMDVSMSYDTIYVTEVDTASVWANCMCTFDLSETITGLQSGTYFVKVFRKMPLFYPDTLFYIGSTSFIYGGSILTFSLQSYQSECYNITEVKGYEEYPKEFTLEQNYPNPFNPSTVISFQLPVSSQVTLKVYDILGREVSVLITEAKSSGEYKVEFNANSLSSGIYFYRLQTERYSSTKKLILIK